MSTWTAPATWVNGAITAAQMNTEIRDHLNWLKGFADLITASTASDVGTTTRLAITRTNASDDILQGKVTGDAFQRFTQNADGAEDWGSGAAAADLRLRRSAGGVLTVDNGAGGAASLEVYGSVSAGLAGGDLLQLVNTGYMLFNSRVSGDVASGNVPNNTVALYCRTNATTGKSQLMARFTTGNPIPVTSEL